VTCPCEVILAFGLLGGSFSVAEAQREPPVDSLVTQFIERGTLSSWGPYQLFTGCPGLKDWQERGFRRLASANLSSQRTNDLAGAWAFALRDCNDRRLEQWYFEHLNAAIRRGEGERMYRFWVALSIADSPQIRDYLRGLMLDLSMPMGDRDGAGVTLFKRFGTAERLQEYLRIQDEALAGRDGGGPDGHLAETGSRGLLQKSHSWWL
jgi:hypothetical protein